MVKKLKFMAAGACIATMLFNATQVSAEPWKFGIMGDTQWKGNLDGENPNTVAAGIIRQINAEFIRHGVKIVLQVGDLVDVYSSAAFDTRAELAQELFDAGIGFFPLRGNHEPGSNAANYFSTVFPQTCGYTNTFGATNFNSASYELECLSYSFDYNNVRFVLIDQFTRKNNSGNTNNNVVDQLGWIDTTLSNRNPNTHAFVLGHKNLVGQNHMDVLFGSSPNSNLPAQNIFIKSLQTNNVRYYISGHDHIHHRSIITSPDGNYTVNQLIGASNSYKFYTPSRYPYSRTELPLAQELYTIGYYIFTVDGPNVTVEYYSSLNGCGGTWGAGVSCDLTTTPKNLQFIKREIFGYSLAGKRFVIHPEQTLTIVKDTCRIPGSLETVASIVNGTNNISSIIYDGRLTVQEINTGWKSKAECNDAVQSDILTLWGMENSIGSKESDVYTLSMSYGSGISGPLVLMTKDDSGNWINAVNCNFESSPKFVVGPYKTSYTPGTYGIDPSSRVVWAVLNHGGEFAIGKSSDGDLNGDGIIDESDIEVIKSLKNKPAEINPLADLDNDGKITIMDARKLVLIKSN